MQNPRLASRYAKSLLDLAIEQNSLDATLKDVQLLNEVCRHNPDFNNMLGSPVIHADKKMSIINAIFSSRISKLTQAFTKLLVEKGREANLPDIAAAFIASYKEMKKIRTVKLTTAISVDDKTKTSIQQKVMAGMTDSTIELETETDPALIGGFVLEMDDKLFDASVRRELKDIRNILVDDNYVSKMR